MDFPPSAHSQLCAARAKLKPETTIEMNGRRYKARRQWAPGQDLRLLVFCWLGQESTLSLAVSKSLKVLCVFFSPFFSPEKCLQIDFLNMLQTNLATKKQRKIRWG